MDAPMKRSYALILIFTVLIGAIAATQAYKTVEYAEGVSCANKRIASFGFTHKQVALAELAAIATWQREAEKKEPGFGDWHLANRRSMKCKLFRGSKHYQCVVSARPCKFDRKLHTLPRRVGKGKTLS